MIGIVDYGVGNVGSLGNALRHLELPFIVTHDTEQLSECSGLILPGVGAFEPAMARLKEFRLTGWLTNWAADRRPLLGICLGMQLLLEESSEMGHHTGLGIIPGKVTALPDPPRRVHTGWNQVEPVRDDGWLDGPGFTYFVHSFCCVPDDPSTTLAITRYDAPFVSVLRQGATLGAQFHPEKSQAYGLSLLSRFAHEKV